MDFIDLVKMKAMEKVAEDIEKVAFGAILAKIGEKLGALGMKGVAAKGVEEAAAKGAAKGLEGFLGRAAAGGRKAFTPGNLGVFTGPSATTALGEGVLGGLERSSQFGKNTTRGLWGG